ncbi:hypothetical protein B0H11DRAFT_2247083 [Mycena galericulata]|nr:hypothetical protein B0H11DRAFT_2247083 [Mycena galericulata]
MQQSSGAWLGVGVGGHVKLGAPNAEVRVASFEELARNVWHPLNQFADGIPRRKHVLEVLEVAPLEQQKLSAAELVLQEEKMPQLSTPHPPDGSPLFPCISENVFFFFASLVRRHFNVRPHNVLQTI